MHVRRSDRAADRGRPSFRRNLRQKTSETTQIHANQDIAGNCHCTLLAHIAHDLGRPPHHGFQRLGGSNDSNTQGHACALRARSTGTR